MIEERFFLHFAFYIRSEMKTLVQFVFDGSIVLLHITRILVQMFLTSPKLESL